MAIGNTPMVRLDLPLDVPQQFTWSPDGKTLYLTGMYGQDGASMYLLLKTDLEGNSEVLWTQDADWFSWPSVSPDGDQLALLVWAFPQDICMLHPEPR